MRLPHIMCRRLSEIILHIRYKPIGVPGVCYYCGVRAQGRDHVPPLSLVSEDPDLREGLPFFLLPSCNECNSMLGNNPIVVIEARRAWLYRRYQARYQRELAMPEWYPEEIAELGSNMRSSVRAGLRLKKAVLERIAILGRPRAEPAKLDFLEDGAEEAA